MPGYKESRSRAWELRQAGRFAEALAVVEGLEREGASTAALVVDRADALARMGRPAEALAALEGSPFALSGYGRTLLAGLLENAGRAEEAALLFDELAREPALDRASLARVVRHLRERGEAERAVALVRRVAAEATSPDVARTLADTLEKAGQHRDAVEVLRHAVRAFPGDQALGEHFVLVRLKGEEPDMVVEELETLLAMPGWSGSVRLKAMLGVALRKMGDLPRSRAVLEECAETAPGDAFVLGHLAHVYRDLAEPGRAVELLERVLTAKPGDYVARNTYFAACREAGQQERARRWVEEQAARDPRWKGPLWGAYRKAFRGE